MKGRLLLVALLILPRIALGGLFEWSVWYHDGEKYSELDLKDEHFLLTVNGGWECTVGPLKVSINKNTNIPRYDEYRFLLCNGPKGDTVVVSTSCGFILASPPSGYNSSMVGLYPINELDKGIARHETIVRLICLLPAMSK